MNLGQVDADGVVRWLTDAAATVAENAAYLTELDAAIGDADHGTNLDRGLQAVLAALNQTPPATIEDAAKKAATALVSKVGGASGPLYGTFFLRFAAAAAGQETLTADGFAAALRAGVDGMAARGRAAAGDKTMLDALLPACEAFERTVQEGLGAALAAAATAAEAGRDATKPLVARKGRASYLGERSAGHLDPGAVSAALLIASAARTLG
jgi:dihydroxyacetone kinase-like protein